MSGANEASVAGQWVASITYKSSATAAPSTGDLHALVSQARDRNRRLDITGMLLFENGSFLQTIEGPPPAIAAVWESIQRDSRHHHIEVLSEHMVAARLFSDWAMLLAGRFQDALPPAPAFPVPPPAVAAHLARVVELALNADDFALNALIAGFADQGWTAEAILSLLIEPAARALGDAWLDDRCSELDLTIALSMLQLAGHAVRYSPSAQTIRNSRYSMRTMRARALRGRACGSPNWCARAARAEGGQARRLCELVLTSAPSSWQGAPRTWQRRHEAAAPTVAGVAQWQSRSFPSLRRGFDSLHPLHALLSTPTDRRGR